MSQSGQTRSFAELTSMSGLPSEAAIERPLVRQRSAISGPAQVQQTQQASLDHLVGAGEQRRRHLEA